MVVSWGFEARGKCGASVKSRAFSCGRTPLIIFASRAKRRTELDGQANPGRRLKRASIVNPPACFMQGTYLKMVKRLNPGVPCFVYGHSMGAAIALKVTFMF